MVNKTKNIFKLKGAENVYTQHTPHFLSTIEACLKGKLKDAQYPFMPVSYGTGDEKDRYF